jgi:hypothetical protein
MNAKISMFDLVIPKNHDPELTIGTVIGMSRFDLSIGPILHIRDITTEKLVERFPMHVDKLVRAT